MSLQDEMRAQDMGRDCADPKGLLDKIRAGGSLADTKAECGANMLLIFLLSRWGQLYSPGSTAKLTSTEDFQDEVVDVYLAAGCAVDEAIPARAAKVYLPRPFIEMGTLPGKVSPLTLVEQLREERESWGDEIGAMLDRLHTRLGG